MYSHFQPLQQPGPFQIGLQTKREQASDALKVVEEVLAEFLARGPSEDELKAARRNLADGFPLRIDSNRKLLDHIAFVLALSVGLIAPTMSWVLMAIYTKTNYGIPENLYGWIPTTNALMCVFIQYPVTSVTRRYPTLPVLTVGMLIYAIVTGSVALMSGFWGFWLSVLILTLGELTLVPPASKYVADMAPADLRGRYMSVHWLGWGMARTLAPILGGFLNDNIAPQAIWIGGLLIGLTSTLGLYLLSRASSTEPTLETGS